MANAFLGPTEARLDEVARETIDSYLTALATRLPAPPSACAAIVDELRDGLLEAVVARLDRGDSPRTAVASSIGEFGDPEMVAASFAPEMAAQQSRRVALGLLRTGPLVGLMWGVALITSPVGESLLGRHSLVGPMRLLPLLGVTIATIVITALVAVALTGRFGHKLNPGVNVAPTAAAWAAVAVVFGDLTMLGLVCLQAIAHPGSLAYVPIALAAVASVTRLTLSARAAGRCWAVRVMRDQVID